jgi:hypothetical protein
MPRGLLRFGIRWQWDRYVRGKEVYTPGVFLARARNLLTTKEMYFLARQKIAKKRRKLQRKSSVAVFRREWRRVNEGRRMYARFLHKEFLE